MIEIQAVSSNRQRPYANLVPIVDFLVANGNRLGDFSSTNGDHGFFGTQGGWQCDLALPIDFALIADTFALPDSIDASPRYDSILDRMSWCVVEGPGAEAARFGGPTSG